MLCLAALALYLVVACLAWAGQTVNALHAEGAVGDGAKRFADTPVNSGAGTATFQAAWLLNGGQKADMDRLQDVHVQWMSRLDALAEAERRRAETAGRHFRG